MNRKLAPRHSDWGTFNPVVEGGKVAGAVLVGVSDSVHWDNARA